MTYAEIKERVRVLEKQEAKAVAARDYEHAQDIVREIQGLKKRMGMEEREIDPLQKQMDLHRVDDELDGAGNFQGADFDIEDDDEEGEMEFEEDEEVGGEDEEEEDGWNTQGPRAARGGKGPSAMGFGMGMGSSEEKKGGRSAGPAGFGMGMGMGSPAASSEDEASPRRGMDEDSEDEDQDQVNISTGSSRGFEGKEDESEGALQEGKEEPEEEELREIDLSDKRHFLTSPIPKACGMVKGYVLRYYSNSFNKLHPEYTLHLETPPFDYRPAKVLYTLSHTLVCTLSRTLSHALSLTLSYTLSYTLVCTLSYTKGDDGDPSFLLYAKKMLKNKSAHYRISMNKSQSSKQDPGYLGKVR
jgi:hypothetical protein